MDQGYSREKGQALLGFHLRAGAPLDSSLAVCFKCCAGQGKEGGPTRHVLGTQLLRGQWLQAVRGKGWSRSRGRERRGCSLPGPSAPRRPLGEWVGEQVGPGKLKDRGLSCGLGITVRSQCGCSLCSSPEAAGGVRQSGLRRPEPPESRLRREGSSLHSCPGPEGGNGPSPSPSRPRSGEVKAPEQPDSLRSLLPAGRASAWARPLPWGRRGRAPPAPPGAPHPLPLPLSLIHI